MKTTDKSLEMAAVLREAFPERFSGPPEPIRDVEVSLVILEEIASGEPIEAFSGLFERLLRLTKPVVTKNGPDHGPFVSQRLQAFWPRNTSGSIGACCPVMDREWVSGEGY